MKDTAKEPTPIEPILVYKCPGEHNAGKHGTYDPLPVATQEDLDEALDEGWSKTLPEAAKAAKAAKAPAPLAPLLPPKK